MTIFGVRIMRESTCQVELAQSAPAAGDQVDFWKAKYFYAKARAMIAEQFPRKMTITVTPQVKCDPELQTITKSVEIEVGKQ